jgi:hypothetical protein
MGPGDLQFWKELAHNAAPEGNGSFGLSALAALLSNLSEDEDRARVILECDAFFDDLNPSEHERGTAILRPYFDAAQCPITRAAVRIHDIRRQLRLGQPVDLDQELREIQHPLFTSLVTSLRIAQCVRDRGVARLQSLLAAMPPEALTDVANLPELLPALDLAGLSDEATVLREAGRKRLAADVIQSWASLSQADILRALALAKALDAPDEIPPAWVKDCFVKVDNTELKHRMLMETSMMRSDWTITQSAADRLLRECPGFHRANWYKGLALYQLDRRADAIPPLETFVRLCNDQPEHARAVELLAKLKTP